MGYDVKKRKRQSGFNSLQTKLLVLFLLLYSVLMILILFMADRRLTVIIDESQEDLYREKMDSIFYELIRMDQLWRDVNYDEEYREEIQARLLETISGRYYKKEPLNDYPFIIDKDIITIIHPVLASGTDQRENIPWQYKFKEGAEGEFEANYFGTEKWYLYKWFEPWDWIICYTVPLNVKYQDVDQFQRSLLIIIIGLSLIYIPLVTASLRGIIKPIRELTDITGRISRGDLDQSVPKRGNDEIGALSESISSMQDSIREKISDLNREMIEKTHMKERLAQSQKLDAIGQLAGGVAHDFNNALTGISGAAQILETLNRDGESASYIQMIIESSDKAAALTAKLLAFGRKTQLIKREADLHEIIDDALLILERSLDKKISIELSLNAAPSQIWCDSPAIQNIILNLGVNAAQAMKKGGRLTIGTENRDLSPVDCRNSSFELEPGPYVELTVKDTGPGIPADIRDKIYEPFFTTKERGEGTGMGLASVYGTVQDHRGAIIMESSPEKGTCFTLLLPCGECC